MMSWWATVHPGRLNDRDRHLGRRLVPGRRVRRQPSRKALIAAAYALATSLGAPLLYKGADFAETDVSACI
jgi:hypothetical protein